MFNSSVLDVIIGLVFCFASVALFVSSINEAISSALKLRHKTLLTGIQKMLNDPAGSGLVKALYEHALVNPLSLTMPPVAAVVDPGAAPAPAPDRTPAPPSQVPVKPTTPTWARLQQLPAYIDSKDFAHALMDIIRTSQQAGPTLASDIASVQDPQLRQVLQGFLTRAQDDVDRFADAVANWFDNAMDRLSGSYKRRSQAWTFALGLLAAAALNIDAIHVIEELWKRPELSAAIVSPASKELIAAAASASASSPGPLSADQLMTTLNTLPVGWKQEPAAATGQLFPPWLIRALGWLITASAAVFGAPFWFDLLQQLIQIRGTGAKPVTNADKSKPQVTSAATP